MLERVALMPATLVAIDEPTGGIAYTLGRTTNIPGAQQDWGLKTWAGTPTEYGSEAMVTLPSWTEQDSRINVGGEGLILRREGAG
eukprot:COSAG05_NODE_844_length_7005_cov_92.042716_2_plen_85_part_00